MDDDIFLYPTLGELYPEDVDWQTDEAIVPFCDQPISVCLADGTDEQPSELAMTGYEWVVSNWAEVLKIISDQAFDFYEPYADAVPTVPKFDSPDAIWGTEHLIDVRIFSKDEFTVSMRFEWQEDQDPHEITFYIEQGKCETHSVDG